MTSQKRAQSLQDVPVAVTAVGGDKMDRMGIQTFEDLTISIPNVHVGENTIGDGLFIRGIGSGVNQGFEQSVGVFVDDIYYGRGRMTRSMMFDVERVEVLKGPQGILFGKNTIGGALNIASRNPTDEFEGYVDGRYEFSDNEMELTGAVAGPISDTFRVRLAMRYRDMDGWLDNVATGDQEPSREEFSSRLTAVWDVTPDLEAIFKFQYSDMTIDGRNNQLVRCSAAHLNFIAGADDCTYNGVKSSVSSSQRHDSETEEFEGFTAGMTLNWSVADHTVTSVTSYVEYDDATNVDGDMIPALLLPIDQGEEFDVFAQELRVVSPLGGAFDYIFGAYYETTNLKTLNDFHVNGALLGLASGTRAISNDQDSESWAVFAQATYHLTDQISVTGGLRYTEETKSDLQTVQVTDLYTLTPNAALEPFFNAALNTQPHVFNQSRKAKDLNPSGTIEWRPNSDMMFYGSVKSGFKAGGFDHTASTNNISAFEYDDETALSFEIGSKMTLDDGAATLNIAAFHTKFKNLQVSTFDGAIGYKVGNAGEVTSKGVEVDGRWRVMEDLTLGTAIAYLDSAYDVFPGAQCYNGQTAAEGCIGGVQDLAGQRTQFSPEWAGNFNAEYIHGLTSDLDLIVNLDVNFSDDVQVANDTDPFLTQKAYAKIDLRVALEHLEQGWEIALIGRNLTDKKTFNWANDVPLWAGSYYKHMERPLTVAVQGRLRF